MPFGPVQAALGSKVPAPPGGAALPAVADRDESGGDSSGEVDEMTGQVRPEAIVGVDGSPQSMRAVDLAADEAANRAVPLRIVHGYVWPLFYAPVFGAPFPVNGTDPTDEDRRIAEDAATRARDRHPTLTVSTKLIAGSPAGALVAESAGATVTVVGRRGRGGFAELVAGSVSTQLATHGHGPVIVVPADAAPALDAAVVVGVDGRQPAARAIEFAFDEAALRRVPLRAVYVWSIIDTVHNDPLNAGGYDIDNARHTAERVLAEALAGWQEKYPQVTVHRELVHGFEPAAALVAASAGAGLLVVGSRGRGEFRSLLLGSVGYALVHHARCPVALIHPPAGEES